MKRVLLVLIIGSLPRMAMAEVPSTLGFTGRLVEQGALADGAYPFTFRLYDAPESGVLVWSESHPSLPVAAGIVHAQLGSVDPSGNPLGAQVFDGRVLYLEVTVDGSVLSPRAAIQSAPYAVRAGVAETLGGLAPEDVALVDHDHQGVYLPAGSTLSCSGTQKVIGIDPASGSVVCGDDLDTTSTYGAGLGLELSGTTLSVDTTVIQARVAGGCVAGEAIRVIHEDGTVECEIDSDTDTTYSVGTGLTLTSTTIGVDPSAVQLRVSGSCAVGQAIRAIHEDGTVTCETGVSLADANIWSGLQTFAPGAAFPGGAWDAAGSVGIGTTAPAFPLHVVSAATTMALFDASGPLDGHLAIKAQGVPGIASIAIESADAETSGLSFRTRNTAGAGDRMVIDKDGNVGIGTTTPAANLHVAGRTRSGYYDGPSLGHANRSNGDTNPGEGGLYFKDGYLVVWYRHVDGIRYIKIDVNAQSTTWTTGAP